MNFNFSSINLGCTKNLVDTQHLLGKIFTLTEKEPNIQPRYFSDPYDKEVDIVFLNTCGFISSARDEAAHTLEKLLQKGKKVYLLGCAVQYYKNLNSNSHSRFASWGGNPDWSSATQNIYYLSRNDFNSLTLKQLINGYHSKNFNDFEFTSSPRVYTNIEHKFEYLKIAEWCDNNCSFCIIPKIRGKQKSLSIEAIVQEAKNMINNGIEEIILIAQDTTRYGTDLYGKPMLFELLQEIDKIKWNFRFRLLYLYPDILTLDHLKKLTKLKKFIPYFDIPLQHISAPLLKKMGRFYNEEAVYQFLNFIKDNFPKRFIRTNIIIGFPGETDEDQQKLLWFLNNDYFNNIALFEYHDEPLAASSKLPGKIDDKTLKQRFIEADDIVDKLLTKKEKKRKWTEETWYIMEIKQKKNLKPNTQHSTQLQIRPLLHCPEIDSYDNISLDQIIGVENNKTNLEIGDKIQYIV